MITKAKLKLPAKVWMLVSASKSGATFMARWHRPAQDKEHPWILDWKSPDLFFDPALNPQKVFDLLTSQGFSCAWET